MIRFSKGEFALGDESKDRRLDRRRFLELDENLKHQFWNYQFVVEQLTSSEHNYVREIFDRVNRNTKRLTNQEVRHARFDGWFATRVDTEIEADTGVWRQFGVVTPARARRMSDAQFVAELFILIIGSQIIGFDQDIIDTYYAEYEEPPDTRPEFVEDEFEEALGRTKTYLLKVESFDGVISKHAKTVAHFYSLWALTTLEFSSLPSPQVFSKRYDSFMSQVESLTREAVSQQIDVKDADRSPAVLYYLNAQSATTDAGPRNARHKTLKEVILDDENSKHS